MLYFIGITLVTKTIISLGKYTDLTPKIKAGKNDASDHFSEISLQQVKGTQWFVQSSCSYMHA